MQALFEQATPFADALAAAARDSRIEQDTFSATFTAQPAPETGEPRRMRERTAEPEAPAAGAGLYGPQPNAAAIEHAVPTPVGATPAAEPVAPPLPPVAAEPVAPPPPPVVEEPEPELEAPAAFEVPAAPVPAGRPTGIARLPSADAAERLIAAGISPALAADVVAEAVVHGLPFSAPRNMKRLVRTAFARRIPTTTALGPGPRTIAIVGGGGSGKSSAVAHLAAVYAAAGADVAVVELRGHGALAGRLQPLGVGVIAAADAEQAIERLGAREPLITLIDTPATGPSTKPADVKALAADLKALGAEVHMALPATISSVAAGEVAARSRRSPRATSRSPTPTRPRARAPRSSSRWSPAVRCLTSARARATPPIPARWPPSCFPDNDRRERSVSKLVVGQHVVVRHLHVGMLPGTIESGSDGSVVVALAVKDERIARTIGHDWAVEATSGRGIFRFPAAHRRAQRIGSRSR